VVLPFLVVAAASVIILLALVGVGVVLITWFWRVRSLAERLR